MKSLISHTVESHLAADPARLGMVQDGGMLAQDVGQVHDEPCSNFGQRVGSVFLHLLSHPHLHVQLAQLVVPWCGPAI